MALFKINKGPASNLGASGNPTEAAQEGFAYFTPDDGKFYIDIDSDDTAVIGTNRIPINSYMTDKFSSNKVINVTGDVVGSASSDATTGWTIGTELAPSGVIDGIYGPEASTVTNGRIVIPQLTINEKGIITNASSYEVTLQGFGTDRCVEQKVESNNGSYYPLFTPKNQTGDQTTTSTYNAYVKVNPSINEWTFLTNNSDSLHDTPSFILSRSTVGVNYKLWGSQGDLTLSSDYWENTKKNIFSEHILSVSPTNQTITLKGDLLPITDNTWDIGNSTKWWSTGYFKSGLYIGSTADAGSATLPIYWHNGVPTPITSYEGTAARAIGDADGNNIKNSYAADLSFANGLFMLKNKNGSSLASFTIGTLTAEDIATGTETVSKFVTAKAIKDNIVNLINSLDVAEKTFADGEVLKTLKQENGKIALTTGQLSLDRSIISNKYVINLKEDNTSFSQVTIDLMTGATASAAGEIGLVPKPAAGDQTKFLRADGTWVIPTNTDTKVTQTISTDSNADYRVLFSNTADNTTRTETARKSANFYYNPSTNTLKVGNIDGIAAQATQATSDGLGQNIVNTYLTKAAGVTEVTWDKTNKKIIRTINGSAADVVQFVAGSNITLTADNGKLTLASANDNTTYSLSGSLITTGYQVKLTPSTGAETQTTVNFMTAATADAGGSGGLVPASSPGDQNKFLRADKTWAVPTNTDTKVEQQAIATNADFRVLLSYAATDDTQTNIAYKSSGLTFNPNSNTVKATNFDGHATSASKANNDGEGNLITTTYAKKAVTVTNVAWDKTNKKITKTINGSTTDVLSLIAGTNVTLTAADGSITITSANDNTTYGLSGSLVGNTFVTSLTAGGSGTQSTVPAMGNASASAAGTAGLVPAPPKNGQNKILSGSGWVDEYSYTLPLASSTTRGGIKIGYTTNAANRNYAIQLEDEKAYVNVPWTDDRVTAPLYHYEPVEDNSSALTANASGATAAWSIDVVKGVKIRRDNRGHITGLEVVSGKIPAKPTYPNDRDPGYGVITIGAASSAVTAPTSNTNTVTAATYSESVKFNASNKWIALGATDSATAGSDNIYFGHILSGVTAGNYGLSANATPANGGQFSVPYITVDAAGHVTGASTKTVTLPSISDTKVTQNNSTVNSDFRVILSYSATNNNETQTVYKSGNLIFNPSGNKLSTGNLKLTGELDVTGDAYLRNETYADSLTTDSLLVNGSANFVQIPTAPTATAGSNNSQLATTEFVTGAVSSLAGPMRFMGTLGTGGTVTAIPAAAAANKGYAYKVITAGTYQSVAAKVGDVLVSTGNTWILIPSGDEPSGTITNISIGEGLTGTTNPIVSTGDIKHAIPTGANAATLGSTTSRYYIKTITTDQFGHVTGVTTGNETVTNSNTWRKVQLNGTDILGTATTTNPLNLVPGTNISITNSNGSVTFKNSATDTLTGSPAANKTVTAFDQVDGAVTATFADIAINGAQTTLGTASVAVVTDANKHLTTQDLSTSDPTTSGSGITYIATISQSKTGKITATKSTVRDASASQSGVVSTAAQEFKGLKTIRYTEGHYSTTSGIGASKFYKIKINSTTSWMLTFTIRVYHGYNWNDIVISGYNYSSTKTWYSPKATMLGGNHDNEINVYFGKDGDNELWVGLSSNNYTGLDIFQVTNGLTQITDTTGLFTITLVDDLGGTQVSGSPFKVRRPVRKGETITYTPEGANAKSAVTISPKTTNVYSMTSAGSVTAGTAPSLTMSVDESTETLSFAWSAGTPTAVTLPGRSSAIAAWTGYNTGVDNTYAAAQTFTGTQATLTI